MEFFSKLGIDWRLLIFQMVNFGILLFLLHRFLYRPVLRILEQRRQKIEESLVFARDIEKKMKEVQEESERQIRHAKNQARAILDKTAKDAEKVSARIVEESKIQANQVLAKAREEIGREKQKVASEIKKEAGELVLAAVEKVLREKIDDKKDRQLIKETIK